MTPPAFDDPSLTPDQGRRRKRDERENTNGARITTPLVFSRSPLLRPRNALPAMGRRRASFADRNRAFAAECARLCFLCFLCFLCLLPYVFSLCFFCVFLCFFCVCVSSVAFATSGSARPPGRRRAPRWRRYVLARELDELTTSAITAWPTTAGTGPRRSSRRTPEGWIHLRPLVAQIAACHASRLGGGIRRSAIAQCTLRGGRPIALTS